MATLKRVKELFFVDEPAGILTRHNGKPAGTIIHRPLSDYIRVMIDSKEKYAHRIIWMLRNDAEDPKGLDIDHKDGNGLNNRVGNTSAVTRGVNARNQRLRSDNTSGITGLTFNNSTKLWHASAVINGVREVRTGRNKESLALWLEHYRNNSGEFSARHGK